MLDAGYWMLVLNFRQRLIPWFSVTKNKKFSLRLGVFARDMFLIAVIRVRSL